MLLVPITFSAITYSNNTGCCKQMGYIYLGFEVICFMHYCYIQIGWVKTDSQLEISLHILPPTSTKLLIQGGAWFPDFKIPTCNILSISFLKDSLRCTGIGQQGVYFGASKTSE